jgi:hypothetical protein
MTTTLDVVVRGDDYNQIMGKIMREAHLVFGKDRPFIVRDVQIEGGQGAFPFRATAQVVLLEVGGQA